MKRVYIVLQKLAQVVLVQIQKLLSMLMVTQLVLTMGVRSSLIKIDLMIIQMLVLNEDIFMISR